MLKFSMVRGAVRRLGTVAVVLLLEGGGLAQTTERASVDSSGNQGNQSSSSSSISWDGRYVAFYSDASNLVPGDTNGCGDIFVHDRQTGATKRVSVDSSGGQGNGGSLRPVDLRRRPLRRVLQPRQQPRPRRHERRHRHLRPRPPDRRDGARQRRLRREPGQRHLLRTPPSRPTAASWRSRASPPTSSRATRTALQRRLRPRPPDRRDRARQRRLGRGPGQQRLPTSSPPSPPTAASWRSRASPPTSSPATRTAPADVFVHDRQTGATERVSVDSSGTRATTILDPSISADGRFVAFESAASNLVAGRHERLVRRLRARPPDGRDGARQRRLLRRAGERRLLQLASSPPTAASWRSRASPRTSSGRHERRGGHLRPRPPDGGRPSA